MNLNSINLGTNVIPSENTPNPLDMVTYVIKKHVQKVLDPNYDVWVSCNKDFSICNVDLIKANGSIIKSYPNAESHQVKLEWVEPDLETKKIVSTYSNQVIDDLNGVYENIDDFFSRLNYITDLTLLNYFINEPSNLYSYDNISSYLPSLRKIFTNSNVSYNFDMTRGGGNIDFDATKGGTLYISYNGTIYDAVNYVVGFKTIIYIPDETPDTPEDFIKAAKKRIDDYFGPNNVKIEIADLIDNSDMFNKDAINEYIDDVSKMGDYYYNVTAGNKTNIFLIMKNSNKLEKPIMETTDSTTNIGVSSEDSSLPLDVIVKTKELKNDHQIFNLIKKILKFQNDDSMQVFDFELFSKTLDKNITKTNNGEFVVSIPITDSIKSKKITVYYVADDNTIEEYPVEIIDGIATFKTKHFSVYTIVGEEIEDTTLDSIIKDNTINIDSFVPISHDEMHIYDVNGSLSIQYANELKATETIKNKNLKIKNCSEDFKTCNLIYSSTVDNETKTKEVNVNVNWKKDSLESYSDLYKQVAPNGVFEINAVKQFNDDAVEFVSRTYIRNNLNKFGNLDGMLYACDFDNDNCRLQILTSSSSEVHIVKVKWQKANPNIKKITDEYVKELNNKQFNIRDLNTVSFYKNAGKSFYSANFKDVIANYAEGIKDIIKHHDISYDFINCRGSGAGHINGGVILYYDDVAYGAAVAGFWQSNVIFIPDNTPDTPEDFIKAAKKRIDDYLGKNNIKFEIGGNITDAEDMFAEFYEYKDYKSKMSNYYYTLTFDGFTKDFLIIKDSSNIKKANVETIDTKTNITISIENNNVPFDIKVKVETIDESSKAFKEIKKFIDIKNIDEAQIYDLKLFSKSFKANIETIKDGEFKVSIPIKDSLKDKDLIAYYIKDDGTVEEHPVTVENGIGTFTTTHFSIYTIMEKLSNVTAEIPNVPDVPSIPSISNVPNTYDGITTFIILGVISFIILGISIFFLKKENLLRR